MRQLQASQGGKPREHLPNLYFFGLCKGSLCMLIMPSLTLIAWTLRSNWTLFYPICGMFCCLKVRWENLVTFCEARLSWHKVSILSDQGSCSAADIFSESVWPLEPERCSIEQVGAGFLV